MHEVAVAYTFTSGATASMSVVRRLADCDSPAAMTWRGVEPAEHLRRVIPDAARLGRRCDGSELSPGCTAMRSAPDHRGHARRRKRKCCGALELIHADGLGRDPYPGEAVTDELVVAEHPGRMVSRDPQRR